MVFESYLMRVEESGSQTAEFEKFVIFDNNEFQNEAKLLPKTFKLKKNVYNFIPHNILLILIILYSKN